MKILDLALRSSGQGLSLVSTWMRQGFVRSIQSGTIDLNNVTSNTATINVVNVNNTILIRTGNTHAAAGPQNDAQDLWTLALTNSTTVTAQRVTGEATAFPCGFVVIEFFPGILRSVQSGTIDVNGGTSATASITAVNTSKAWLIHLGNRVNNAGDITPQKRDTLLTLTNATTVTASVNTNPAVSNVTSFMVAEFM